MTAIRVPDSRPMYIALSTDISGSKIPGATIFGGQVYLTDTGTWKIVDQDGKVVDLKYTTTV